MNTELIEETPEMPEGFHIDSDDRANWILRKIRQNQEEKEFVLQQAAAIAAALESDTASLMHRFGAELEEYTRGKLAEGGNKRKSFRFLQGTCAFRNQGPVVKVKDTDAAIEWAKQNAPALVLVETQEKLDGDAFRRQAEQIRTQTGELLPGVEFSEGGDSFSVSFPDVTKSTKKRKSAETTPTE